MILVRKKYLYVLVCLFFLLLVFGEIKFFFALRSINLKANLDVKYEIESFIFASIVFVLIVYLFLMNFIRTSENILKKLDKLIELSRYGKYDISMQLKQMGILGLKVNYLILSLNRLSGMKSLKISSLAGINDFLIAGSSKLLFLLDHRGNILNCSDRLLGSMKIRKKRIVDQDLRELFRNIDSEELLFGIRKNRGTVVREGLPVKMEGREQRRKVVFYPIANTGNEVSHVIGVIAEE